MRGAGGGRAGAAGGRAGKGWASQAAPRALVRSTDPRLVVGVKK